MFYHKACNFPVLVENNCLKVVSEFTILYKGIKPSVSDIIEVEDTNKSLKFYCSHCQKTVSSDELFGLCFNCGKHLELNALYKVSKHAGTYCLKCYDTYLSEYNKKAVSTLIKLSTGGNE